MIDFTDIEVVEENECDLCGRWMEVGEEMEYENASCFDAIYICSRCYEEVQRKQTEPLEM